MLDIFFSVVKFLFSKKLMLQSLFDKFIFKGEQENFVGYVEIIFYKGGGGVCILCIVGNILILCIVYCWEGFNEGFVYWFKIILSYKQIFVIYLSGSINIMICKLF